LIKAITYKNFKGQTCEQELTGKDIFIGPNGSGKTTKIQSISYGVLGYIPGNGKTSQETFKMATGPVMEVGLRKDDFEFSRRLEKSSKYDRKTGNRTFSISESFNVAPGRGETNNTQKKARIESEIGNFAISLDFGEFLAMSDNKRRDFFYGLSPINSNTWDRERIETFLDDQLLTLGLKVNNPDHYMVMVETINEVMTKYPKTAGVSDGLQAMIDYVSAQLSVWKSKQADAKGAVRQISEIKNEMEQTDRNIAEYKKELEEIGQKLLDLSAQIAGDKAKKEAIDNRSKKIAELEATIATYKTTPVDDDTSNYDREIAELTAQLEDVPDFKADNETLSLKITAVIARINTTQEHKIALQGKLAGYKNVLGALRDALNSTNGLKGRCVIHNLIECPKNFEGFEEFVAKKEAEAKPVVEQLEAEIAQATAELQKLRDELANLRTQQGEKTQKAQEVIEKNSTIQTQIAMLEKGKAAKENAKKSVEEKIKFYEAELEKVLNAPITAIGPVEIMERQLEALKNRQAELKTIVADKEQAKNSMMLLQQSMIDNKKAEYKAACFKSISELIGAKGIKGEMVKEILEPIRQNIRDNLCSMGFDFEPYFVTESDTAKEVFQFGWINQFGNKVNFDALSAGQQMIFLAAMMATIIERANPKLKLLVMDNINHLDEQNLHLFIKGVSVIADKMDNTILSGVINLPSDKEKRAEFMKFFSVQGWKVWDLGQQMVDVDYVVRDGGEVA
jgi:uncharacterized coiled-coil DUF342 family protein